METIVPATGEWNLCIDNTENRSDFFRITILAWVISPSGLPVPITPFGRADTSGEYMVHTETLGAAQFVVLPNGPVLPGNDFNGAKAWLKSRGAA